MSEKLISFNFNLSKMKTIVMKRGRKMRIKTKGNIFCFENKTFRLISPSVSSQINVLWCLVLVSAGLPPQDHDRPGIIIPVIIAASV